MSGDFGNLFRREPAEDAGLQVSIPEIEFELEFFSGNRQAARGADTVFSWGRQRKVVCATITTCSKLRLNHTRAGITKT